MSSDKIRNIAEVLAKAFPKTYLTEDELIAGWRHYQAQREYSCELVTIDDVADRAMELFKRRYKHS